MMASSPLDRSTIAEIMRRWQTAATAHWTHLDPPLLSSGGLLWQAMHSVVTLLSGADPLAILTDTQSEQTSRQTSGRRQRISSRSSRARSAQETNTPSATPHRTQEIDGDATDTRLVLHGTTILDGLDEALQIRAERLAALPIAWPDQRKLLHLLLVAIRQTLNSNSLPHQADVTEPDNAENSPDEFTNSTQSGTPSDSRLDFYLAYYEGAVEALSVRIADICIQRLQQQIDDQHEQSLATEHLAERFLGNASHDLRTPLTAIIGFADLLLEGTYGELTPEQMKHIGDIENSAANLDEIISNMLDLLRIRAGKLILNYRPVVVDMMLRAMHQILTPLAGRKNLVFRLELTDELGIVEMDEGIVRHIVYYLLSSALRATPAGGEVVLRSHREQNLLVIEAQDTALHLPPDAIANMMDPFPRLENSPVRGYEGWEVGLPLVRRYVELHHGTLRLESLPDKGTVFYVSLPTKRPKPGDN